MCRKGWIFIILSIVVIICTSLSYKETYSSCTDGCIIPIRNQGIYIDNTCQSLCTDDYLPNGVYVDNEQERAMIYYNNLTDSVNNGQYMYKNGP